MCLNFASNKKLKTMHNQIGIETQAAQSLIIKLNNLLANYQLYYQNLRAFHWNIKGENFFELHTQFETLYTQANTNIDAIAERILTLGGKPFHKYSDYLSNAQITEATETEKGRETVAQVVQNLSVLLKLEREILNLSAEVNDEGTDTLMSDNIAAQEKLVWMFNAWLAK
jgi:starvation-inducible DNA-binding protein